MSMTYTAAPHQIAPPRYPNAAPRALFWNKCADALLCTASTIGIVVAFFFLLTM